MCGGGDDVVGRGRRATVVEILWCVRKIQKVRWCGGE